MHSGGSAAEEFPVDLVQIGGEEDHAADDTGALGGLDDELGATEEELEFGPHGRGVVAFREGKFSALGAEGDVGVVGEDPFGWPALDGGEVNGIGVGGETFVVRAVH